MDLHTQKATTKQLPVFQICGVPVAQQILLLGNSWEWQKFICTSRHHGGTSQRTWTRDSLGLLSHFCGSSEDGMFCSTYLEGGYFEETVVSGGGGEAGLLSTPVLARDEAEAPDVRLLLRHEQREPVTQVQPCHVRCSTLSYFGFQHVLIKYHE